jgi:hypothetical protein
VSLTTFTVTQTFGLFTDLGSASGQVVIEPLFHDGDVALTTGQTPTLTGLPTQVSGQIIGGALCQMISLGVTRAGVKLLCDQAALGLSGPLYYRVTYSNMLVGTTSVTAPKSFIFQASATSNATVDLHDVAPVPGAIAAGLTTLPSTGISDSTTLGRQLLTAPDATTARGYLGLSGGEWEEYANLAAFPGTGNTAYEYLAQDTGKLYRWTGSAYQQISDKSAVGLGNVDNTSDATKNSAAVALTNKDLTSGTNTFPTFNQNTTGSAAKWTTARNLAGNSVDGSANVAFSNKFIVQGTSDSGLSGPQFLGALGTGLVKNTTTTGVLSIATAGTDYVSPSSSEAQTNKTITLAAGSTSVAPLRLTSGTNLTTPATGAVEYDGTVFYATAAASTRQVVNAEQFITLTSTYTLTSQTAAQKLFNTSTNGAVTLPVGTYYFECLFTLSSMSASSGAFGWDLTAGTATISGISWASLGNKAALATAASPQSTVNTAANTTIVTATANTVGWALIRGKARISVAGTVTPQVSLGVAATAVVGVDSYFRIVPVGSNTVTNVGNWS